ncbi:MAG: hypothetical protein A2284_13245 [Deltaproteobacteria bacterium RIFOXYA12_FULL_61_11]|nr:MAG: hypothetical protein A2284_13245 [Deltaproteobacteria bacterium RIFOXYA12_FULL_61_11]
MKPIYLILLFLLIFMIVITHIFYEYLTHGFIYNKQLSGGIDGVYGVLTAIAYLLLVIVTILYICGSTLRKYFKK